MCVLLVGMDADGVRAEVCMSERIRERMIVCMGVGLRAAECMHANVSVLSTNRLNADCMIANYSVFDCMRVDWVADCCGSYDCMRVCCNERLLARVADCMRAVCLRLRVIEMNARGLSCVCMRLRFELSGCCANRVSANLMRAWLEIVIREKLRETWCDFCLCFQSTREVVEYVFCE